MIEAGAKEVPEDKMIEAIFAAHELNKKVNEFFAQIIAEVGKEKHEYEQHIIPEEVTNAIVELVPAEEMEKAVFADEKQTRRELYCNPERRRAGEDAALRR